MQGVRDQLKSLQRLTSHIQRPGDTICLFLEQNMEDTFKNIPKDGVTRAVKWGCGRLRKRPKTVWFVVAKGGLKHLDRIGQASYEV